MITTRKQRAAILDASFRANRAADALRYLDAAVGCASEAGLQLKEAASTMRADLMGSLKDDAEIAGFKASEFYSQE